MAKGLSIYGRIDRDNPPALSLILGLQETSSPPEPLIKASVVTRMRKTEKPLSKLNERELAALRDLPDSRPQAGGA